MSDKNAYLDELDRECGHDQRTEPDIERGAARPCGQCGHGRLRFGVAAFAGSGPHPVQAVAIECPVCGSVGRATPGEYVPGLGRTPTLDEAVRALTR